MDNYLRTIDRKIVVCGKLMLRNSNIVAVGRGNKRINGEMIKNRPTLTVFVEKKLANSAIENTQRIPKIIGGIETDVYEINSNKDSKLTKLGDGNMITDLKPALGGGTIAVKKGGNIHLATLTYGCVDKESKKKLYAITSAHIFTDGKNPMTLGESVSYFRGTDERGFAKAWRLGSFVGFKTKQYVQNDIDVAAIYVGNNNLENKKLIAPGLINGKIITSTHVVTQDDINNKEKVYKIGITTGYTEGEILTIKTMKKVYDGGNNMVIDTNQVISNMKAEGGDSGGLGVMKRTQQAFGMLNSGTGDVSYFSEIDTVLKGFNLELLI